MKRKKTKSSFAALVPLGAGLLILGGPAPSFGNEDGASELRVQIEEGLISLTARDVPLQEVVREIAVLSDLRLVQHVTLDRLVSFNIERQALPIVLEEILENDSYQLYRAVGTMDESGSSHVPGALWIFSEGSALVPAATAYFEIVILEGDTAEKYEAIRSLGKLGTPAAVQTLSVALGDEDPLVRKAAMEALSGIGSDEAVAAIASVSVADDALVRGKAAYALAMTGEDSSSIEYLKLALHDENPLVRTAAIDALGDIGDAYSIQMIQQALQDSDLSVRERALEVVNEINDDAAFRALYPVQPD